METITKANLEALLMCRTLVNYLTLGEVVGERDGSIGKRTNNGGKWVILVSLRFFFNLLLYFILENLIFSGSSFVRFELVHGCSTLECILKHYNLMINPMIPLITLFETLF